MGDSTTGVPRGWNPREHPRPSQLLLHHLMEKRRPMVKLLPFRFLTSMLNQPLDLRMKPLFPTKARAETLVMRRTAAPNQTLRRTSEPEPRSMRGLDKFLVKPVHNLYTYLFFNFYLLELNSYFLYILT